MVTLLNDNVDVNIRGITLILISFICLTRVIVHLLYIEYSRSIIIFLIGKLIAVSLFTVHL